MTNQNCLSGLRCPNCGNEEPLVIGIHTLMRMLDKGSDAHGDAEWNEESSCSCEACQYTGLIRDFRIPPVEGNKIITASELAMITNDLLANDKPAGISSIDYSRFLTDITEAVCKISGGIAGTVSHDEGDGLGHAIAIRPDIRLPPDGGIWANYDTDVDWQQQES